MIHIAICDDEGKFVGEIQEEIESILKEQGENFEISDYTDGNKLILEYPEKKFDLVLLDIDMPDMNGFEVASTLKEFDHLIEVIFITSHDHLVYDSFRYKPLAFIPKDRLKKYLKEYVNLFVNKYKLDTKEFVYLDDKKNSVKLKISDVAAFFIVDHDMCFLGKDNLMHTIYRKRKTLSDIYKEYGECGFIKINRSTLVNVNYIRNISSGKITLLSGKEINYNRNNHVLILQEYRRLKI